MSNAEVAKSLIRQYGFTCVMRELKIPLVSRDSGLLVHRKEFEDKSVLEYTLDLNDLRNPKCVVYPPPEEEITEEELMEYKEYGKPMSREMEEFLLSRLPEKI
jgi:hypothetical protein